MSESWSVVSDSATPWTVAYQVPPSMGFSRQEYWNGLPYPSPGDLPDPEIKPWSPALQADTLPSEPLENKGSVKECTNYHTIALISHACKVMLKILQAIFPPYVNQELPDVQAGFRKGRGTRDQIANTRWIIEKAREFQKNIYFCFIDYAKAFDCVDHNKLWKILQEMGIPNYLTCLLRNLYAGQEAKVKDCILSTCLYYLYAEYII